MEDDGFKTCPFCKEKIRATAVKCRFCGEWFEQPPSPIANQSVTQEPEKKESVADDKNSAEQISLTQEDFKPKKSEPPRLKVFDVPPHKLYLVGTGFLLAGIAVVIWMFRDVDFTRGDPDKVTTLMAAMILKPILGSIALAWAVHGFFGKRKGYMFLVFAITWMLMMAWCAVKFREGFNGSRTKSKANHEHMAAFASNMLEYAQNPQSTSLEKIKATADDNNNSVLIPVMEFSKQLAEAVEKRDQSLAALQERDIYDLSLLANKSDMELEMQKRLSGQAIVETFKTNVNQIIENTRRRYGQIIAPEKDKVSSLKGFEKSIKNQEPSRENSYRLLITRQMTECDYLKFLCDSFKDYQIKDGKILFYTDEALAGYNAKLKIIDDTEKEMVELRQSMLNSGKKSAQQLLKK